MERPLPPCLKVLLAQSLRLAEAAPLEQRNKALAEEVLRKSTQLNDMLARRNERSGDDKEDALSVFGSFNGSAKGDAKGAGLALGKSFSTGVAAQNLTQGLAGGSKQVAIAACIDAGERAIQGAAPADQTLLRTRFMTLCTAN